MAQLVPSKPLRRLIAGFCFGTTGALVALSPVGKESGALINPVVPVGFWLKRSTLADALAARDGRSFADLAQHLIGQARRLYADEPMVLELEQTVYALDARVIDPCLSLYPWARFHAWRSGIKLHTQLEWHAALPAQLLVSSATFQEVVGLDQLRYERLRHLPRPSVRRHSFGFASPGL